MVEQAASSRMAMMINAYQLTYAISVAAELGIADLLAEGPKDSDALAGLTSSHPPTLYRLLRALAAAGIIQEEAGRIFSLNDLGDCLRTDAQGSSRSLAILSGRPYYREAWGHLRDSVRTGKNAFRQAFGTGLWEYRAERPEESRLFDEVMATNSARAFPAILSAYDFSQFKTVMDVGGGNGALLHAILKQNSGQSGILFDQPHVVEGATTLFQDGDVSGRCRIVGGSFFERVPQGSDAVVLKWILHDWDDLSALNILRVCRRAMLPTARMLLIESIIGPPNTGFDTKIGDLSMLALPGGLERTETEFAALLSQSGFTITKIVPTGTKLHVIEASIVD